MGVRGRDWGSWAFSFQEVVMSHLQGMGQNNGYADLGRTGFGGRNQSRDSDTVKAGRIIRS